MIKELGLLITDELLENKLKEVRDLYDQECELSYIAFGHSRMDLDSYSQLLHRALIRYGCILEEGIEVSRDFISRNGGCDD